MWTIGDVVEGVLRFVRETRAPLAAAVWALAAFVIAAIVHRRREDNFGLKLGGSLLAVGGAAGSLLWWSLQRGPSYYFSVEDVTGRVKALHLRRAPVTIEGCVQLDSLEQRRGTDDYRFRIEGHPGRLPAVIQVRYTGSLPDAFRPGIEVAARGKLAADGSLDVEPDGILTRCPSSYRGTAPPWTTDCVPVTR